MSKANVDKSAAHWEGYQAHQIRQPCKYPEGKTELRRAWSVGFGVAVAEQRAGKVWWKSNTIKAGAICLVVGVLIILYGRFVSSDSNGMMMATGGGVSVSGLINIFLRTALRTNPVQWSSGGNSWYSGQ